MATCPRVITLRNDPTDVRAVLHFVRRLPSFGSPAEPPDHAAIDRGLTGPVIRDHDQLGELREYASRWGRLEVSPRGNVVRMVATHEPNGRPHIDLGRASEIAADFVEGVVEDAGQRNFKAEASGDGGGVFEFRWVEQPRPGQHSIFPNDVTVRIFPQTGQIASFFATDVRAYRTVPPGVDHARLAQILDDALEQRPHEIRRLTLVEDAINGGMDTRTVYRVAVALTPGGTVLHTVVDADSGACLVKPA